MDVKQKNLYSRQIGSIGLDTQTKLSNLKVFVYGLDAIGFEVVKCLTLMGVKKIYICFLNTKNSYHIGRTFHLRDKDDLMNIEEYTINYFKSLNPYVEIISSKISEIPNLDLDVFVQTKLLNSKAIPISNYCRQYNIKYILAFNISYTGLVFCDFGQEHQINDTNGEKIKQTFVLGIKQDENHTYITIDDPEREFYGGMSVRINLPQFINTKFKIKHSKNNVLTFEGKIELPELKNIYLEEIRDTPVVNHMTLEDYLSQDSQMPSNLINVNKPKIAIQLLDEMKFLIQNNKYIGNEEKGLTYVTNSKFEFPTICSILGSIAANEVIKVTGKYTPLQQDLLIDYSCLKPEKADIYKSMRDKNYRDIYSLLSKTVIKKLSSINIFLAGCGALGCEYLKALSMLNVNSNSKKGNKIITTDMDHIELSNLNRQFLFQADNIGHSKSEVACQKIKHFNSNIGVESLDKIIDKSTEDYFNRKFWNNQDIIINALDNISARQYIDNKCLIYDKPLLEAGTLGPKCNVQVIIPYKTKTYSETQDPPGKSIPMCTIKNFPYKIEHCIEWAMEIFNSYLNELNSDISQLYREYNNLQQHLELIDNENIKYSKLNKISKFIYYTNVDDIHSGLIRYSSHLFQEIFLNPISQLLCSFPPEHQNSDGSNFWTGNKLLPQLLNVEESWELYENFTFYLYQLLQVSLGISGEIYNNSQNIREFLKTCQFTDFTPKSNYKFKVKDSDKVTEGVDNVNLSKQIQELYDSLQSIKWKHNLKFNPIIFEKDHDDNGHVALLTSIANLRAETYGIDNTDFLNCKLIAGKVIPALSTTTTLVTGLGIMEMLKYLQESKSCKDLTDHYVNMGINTYLQSSPQSASKHFSGKFNMIYGCEIETRPDGFNHWEKILLSKKKDKIYNIQDVIMYLENEYDFTVDMMSIEDKLVYSKYNSVQKNTLMWDLYKEFSKPKFEYLCIEPLATSTKGLPILIPRVLYCWEL